ncbi:hypothetical protein F4777DRAFT_185920 [Nemania sp. FL0916]|nr:hypothetical protein F4777DRAFT_185920 [Nemania sp. FL0916]
MRNTANMLRKRHGSARVSLSGEHPLRNTILHLKMISSFFIKRCLAHNYSQDDACTLTLTYTLKWKRSNSKNWYSIFSFLPSPPSSILNPHAKACTNLHMRTVGTWLSLVLDKNHQLRNRSRRRFRSRHSLRCLGIKKRESQKLKRYTIAFLLCLSVLHISIYVCM